MGLMLINLDARTRQYMLGELERDIAGGTLYISPRLSPRGIQDYPNLLRAAIENGNDDSLAAELRQHDRLNASLQRKNPKGGYTTARMPVNASETLAEGEFNRFYIRGLSQRAIDDGVAELVIVRAKEVITPRPESTAMIGSRCNPAPLLNDLRANPGVDTALGVPQGPNSGLSVRLPS